MRKFSMPVYDIITEYYGHESKFVSQFDSGVAGDIKYLLDGKYELDMFMKDEQLPYDRGNRRVVQEALSAAAKENYQKAFTFMDEIGAARYAIAEIENLKSELNDSSLLWIETDVKAPQVRERLAIFARNLIKRSHYSENVKLGIGMIGILECSRHDEELKEIIRHAAVCDEFTYLCLQVMRQWADSNEEIMKIANHVQRWGRYYVIKMLRPDTLEIKRWFLRNSWWTDELDDVEEWKFETLIKSGMIDYLMNGQIEYDDYLCLTGRLMNYFDEEPYNTGKERIEDPFREYGGKQIVLNMILRYVDENGMSEMAASNFFEYYRSFCESQMTSEIAMRYLNRFRNRLTDPKNEEGVAAYREFWKMSEEKFAELLREIEWEGLKDLKMVCGSSASA